MQLSELHLILSSVFGCGFRLDAVVVLLLATCAVRADESRPMDEAKGKEFFESKIRPILVRNCYKCHSTEAGKSESGLLLDTRDAIRAGGDRGPAVVPG